MNHAKAALEILLKRALISSDPNRIPVFSETYYTNGDWMMQRQERGPVIIRGRWSVKNGAICVTTADALERCRKLSRGVDDHTFLMRDLFSTAEDVDLVTFRVI